MPIYVQIINRETKAVVKQIECASESLADRVYNGASINLNHDEYFLNVTDEAHQRFNKENNK
jgi:hypothetical protein